MSIALIQGEIKKKSEVVVKNTLNNSFYGKNVKRLLDIICALVGLIILSPAMVIIAILVRIKLGSPVIFKQKRPGLNEKIFTMYKFRTMTNDRDENGNFLLDGERLTKFGKFLRSTSLDELPELFNIIKGDMSFVGPRPQLIKDMVFMSPEQRLRHSVLPGLTGWAQINGRNALSWEEKLALDIEYIDRITFNMDLRIILKTVIKALRREDISANGMDTAEDFGDYLLRTGKIKEKMYYEGIKEAERTES